MIWNPDRETMGRAALEALQTDLLRRQLAHVYGAVPFYRQKYREAGIAPEEVRSLDDLRALPFTTKADFRDHYPFGLLAVHGPAQAAVAPPRPRSPVHAPAPAAPPRAPP